MRQLEKDCVDAKKQYIQAREDLAALYRLHEGPKLERWLSMDRSPRLDPKDKRKIQSVYTHNEVFGEDSAHEMLETPC